MAETLLSFGVEKLWNLLVRESERFQGVKEQFDELKRDLDMLRCFLEDADAKKHTSAMVRNTVKEIKEIVYDAEDIIETFLLKEELGKTSCNGNAIRRLFNRRGLASDMKAISKRICNVIRDMNNLGVIANERDTQSLIERQREIRQTFSSDNEDHLVGLEKNVEQLVGYLVAEDKTQVVSIIGMGGIGKTTLARQVFNHEMVKKHFDGVAWVCISQQFRRKDVWETILQKLSSNQDDQRDSNMSEVKLQDRLFRLLESSNSLIVLDDMWKEEDWDIIKPVFPSRKGWKVLLTSRYENVALRADPTCVIFKPECLTLEESWTLFRRIVFPWKDRTSDVEFEEMGRQMIKHCRGLPLAVKVLGGLLASQHTLNEWERISENIKSHIIGGTNFNDRNISSVYHILSLSFEELPVYLKQCFLYLSHFPEDYKISVKKLSYYWAAEGIPRPRYYDGASIRNVADGYIEELVKRNMVISLRDKLSSRFETCHLHDMMREVCLRKAEEEIFVHVVDTTNSQSPCKSRRMVVHLLDETYDPKGEMMNPKLRSLLFIHHEGSCLRFTRLLLMRVLDLSYVEFEVTKLPSSIGNLIHLRYLSLYSTNVTCLPSSIRNLRKLLYLNLYVTYIREPIYIPNFMKEMQELTYLYLPGEIHDKTKMELGNLINLETLANFSTKNSSVKDLQGMTKLRSLSIYIKGKGCAMETLSSSLREMRHLEDLTIYGGSRNDDEEGFVLDCVHLKNLKLKIYMPHLPDEQQFPSHITTISLEDCFFKDDPMPTLEKLVQLKEVTLAEQSFSGRLMVCSGGGFPQLQELSINNLNEWEDWIVEEGSMPLLHSFEIKYCPKLKEIHVPRGGFPQLHELELKKLDEWEEWIVEKGSMPLLHSLRIDECPKLKQFPAGGFLKLHTLRLSRLDEWEEWVIEEGSMPLLHSLEIEYCPKLKKFRAAGFPQLHKLLLWSLEKWEEWIIEEGSMPLLHTLTIWHCPKLKQIHVPPGGFPQLHELELEELDEWEEWIVEKGFMPLLHSLRIDECPKLKQFPASGFPKLHTLRLSRLDEWEEWVIEEGSMPLLHSLEIKYCPNLKKFRAAGFPQLHKLLLWSLEKWEEWIVEEGSMPFLHSLRILVCPKLKELPAVGFPQLHNIELFGLNEWGKWIVEEGSMPHLHSLCIRWCTKLKQLPAVGFPKLRELELHGLYEWEEWIVEEGSMPLLHSLYIHECPKLKKLPDGLQFIYSLKNLKMDEEWKERLSEGGKEYLKFKHIPSIGFCSEE